MNKDDIAYAAGLFDAEGHVSIGKWKCKRLISPSYGLHIGLTSANRPILNWFKDNFGGYIRIRQQKNINFQWRTSTNVAANFLQQILLYLRIKKPRAELALQFQDEMRTKKKHRQITPESLRRREQFRNRMLTLNREYLGPKSEFTGKCEIAYVAGLLDGDGSISIRKYPRYNLNVNLSSANQSILNWLRDNFGGSVYVDKHQERIAFAWRTTANIAENLLQQIFPYLWIKKSHAELALQFRNEKKQNTPGRRVTSEMYKRREEFRQWMLALNRGS